MKKDNAIAEGLHFTGIYNSDKEITKRRITEARARYPLARIVLVREPVSKLSRSYRPGDCGWAAYADEKYSAYQTIETADNYELRHTNSLKRLKEEYELAVEKENECYENEVKNVKNALQILGGN